MRKIFVITAISDSATGGGSHLVNLVEGLHARGCNITVVCLLSGTLLNDLQQKGIPTQLNLIRGKFDLAGIKKLWALLRLERPAIVHSHGERGMVIANWVAKLAGVPVLITTIHRSITQITYWSWLLRYGYRAVEDLTLRYATTIIVAVSEAMRTILVQNRNHRPQKVVTIYNGVQLLTPESIAASRQAAKTLRCVLNLSDDVYIIGSVGRLDSEKGHITLVQAMPMIIEQVPKACLVLVGDGPELQFLTEMAVSYGVEDRVKFVGHQVDINPWLGLFDLFVLPSLTEAFGLAVAEAMTFSLPVIASEIEGLREIVIHQQSGVLVPPQNPAALALAVRELFQNPQRACQLGKQGYQVVVQKFSIEQMIDQTLWLYESQLEG